MVKYIIVSTNVMPLPPLMYAGLEKLVTQLTIGLIQRGHEVVLVAPTGSNITSKGIDTSKLKIIDGGMPINNERQSYLTYKDALDRYISDNKDAVLISHSWFGYELLFKLKYPKLQVMHTFHGPGGWKIPTDKKLKQMFYDDEFHFIGVSKAHARYISEQMDFVPVDFIYNGVDPSEYPLSHEDKKYDIAFVGVMNQGKGALKLLNMIRESKGEMDSLNVVMAGEEVYIQDPEYTASVRNLASELKNVEYYGEVTNGLKKEIYKKSKILVYPYVQPWFEPFNLTAVESMMMGTPVLMMNNGSAKELIGDNVNMKLFRPACDYDEFMHRLYEILPKLTKDKSYSRTVHDNAMRFDIKHMIDRYEKYFNE